MIEIAQALRERHREALDRMEQGEADDLFLDDVLALLDDLRLAGELVADPAERAQLRALIRFWGGVVYDYTGAYPTVTLLPADVDDVRVSKSPARSSAPPLLWLLAGGASVAVIAAALVVIGWMSRFYEDPAHVVPTVAMVPRVRHVAAEQGLGAGATSPVGVAAFCRGSAEAVFHFVLDGYRPGMDLEWKLRREGTEVSAQPAVAYGDDDGQSLTVRIGSGVPGGLVAGAYDLSLVSGDEVVWVQTFQVLSVTPRAFSFQVSDVPAPADTAAVELQFEPGVRVIYLRYRYEGLCSGLELSHTLYRGGEVTQRIEQVWQGDTEGEAQVTFQASDGTVFVPGEYEIGVSIAGEERGRVSFQILADAGA